MSNGEKFIQTFGNATALYDSELDITTIHIDSDWWDAEYKGVDVLDKITEEIEKYKADCGKPEDIGYFSEVNQRTKGAYETCLRIINYWRNEVSE